MPQLHSNQDLKGQSFIASVLFAEIAGYVDRPVFEQIHYTTQMRQLLELAVTQANSRDLLHFDREESVVVLFAGDPTACFRLAKQLLEVLACDETYRDLPLHLGVNLGPVTIGKNELSAPQVGGVGVDDAARVARAGLLREVLISRAYYTVFARLSKDYRLLEYREFLSDDFDESFAIYQIARPSKSPLAQPVSTPPAPDVATPPAVRRVRWRYAAISAVVALGAFATSQIQRSDTPAPIYPQNVATTKAASATKREVRPAPAAGIVAVEPIPSLAKAAAPFELAKESAADTEEIVALVDSHQATQSSEPQPRAARRSKAAKRIAAAPVTRSATLRLAIKPWGEVYVDGKKVGVTPPLHRIQIPPGKRQIVVRNENFMPYRATIDIQPNSLLKISHRFDQ